LISKNSYILSVITVFPLPGGPSNINIVLEAKEVNNASAISIDDLVQIIFPSRQSFLAFFT